MFCSPLAFYLCSFVMKLFDRSVDFAQFNEDTTLYALARAWMQNKPYGTKPSDSQEGNQDGESPTSSQESVMSSLSHSVSRKKKKMKKHCYSAFSSFNSCVFHYTDVNL